MEKKTLIYGGAAILALVAVSRLRKSANSQNNSDVAYTVGSPAVFPVPFGGGGAASGSSLTSTFGNDAVSPVAKTLTGQTVGPTGGIPAPIVANPSPTPTAVYAVPPGNSARTSTNPPATYPTPANPAPDVIWANYADARDYWKAVDPNSVIPVSDKNAPSVTYAQAIEFLNKYIPSQNFSEANLERAIADARQYYPWDTFNIQELYSAALSKRDVG